MSKLSKFKKWQLFSLKTSKAVVLWICSTLLCIFFSAWDKSRDSSAKSSKLEQMEWVGLIIWLLHQIKRETKNDRPLCILCRKRIWQQSKLIVSANMTFCKVFSFFFFYIGLPWNASRKKKYVVGLESWSNTLKSGIEKGRE